MTANKMTETEDYLFFGGCVIPNRIPFIEDSARKVFKKLGIKTIDAPFGCCPDPVGFNSVDHKSWLALGARNLTIAEGQGKNIISLCNGCTQTLIAVNHELNQDQRKKSEINKILQKVGKEFKGTTLVNHFVKVLKEDIGIEAIKNAIINPFTGLKVACHTGCHFMRPSEIMQYDDPMEPKSLRELVEATGATAIDYEEEVLCCGAGVGNTDDKVSLQVLKRKLDNLIENGADCIVVICPSCFQQFDTNQRNLKKVFEKDYDIPILYLTELLALAMGYKYDDINLKLHRVRPQALLEKYNAV
jgi:heterodisulfide reductase subunit B